MKPDLGTILGLLIAFGAILIGNHLEGGHLSAIIQPTAALIVFGGTLGSVMVSFSLEDFIGATKQTMLVFFGKHQDPQGILDEIVRYAQLARKEGIIALESEAEKASTPFLKKALVLIVDGVNSATLQETLELQLGQMEERGEVPAKVFEAGGGYSPTIGIIGAVLGLIHVMSNLSDVAKVGEGIAVAFVATIYGVALANIFFLPAATKLKMKHHHDMILNEMILHGALAIQQGENPRVFVERLKVFIHDHKVKPGESGAHKPKEEQKAAA